RRHRHRCLTYTVYPYDAIQAHDVKPNVFTDGKPEIPPAAHFSACADQPRPSQKDLSSEVAVIGEPRVAETSYVLLIAQLCFNRANHCHRCPVPGYGRNIRVLVPAPPGPNPTDQRNIPAAA